jgi:hypothetical protein
VVPEAAALVAVLVLVVVWEAAVAAPLGSIAATAAVGIGTPVTVVVTVTGKNGLIAWGSEKRIWLSGKPWVIK